MELRLRDCRISVPDNTLVLFIEILDSTEKC